MRILALEREKKKNRQLEKSMLGISIDWACNQTSFGEARATWSHCRGLYCSTPAAFCGNSQISMN